MPAILIKFFLSSIDGPFPPSNWLIENTIVVTDDSASAVTWLGSYSMPANHEFMILHTMMEIQYQSPTILLVWSINGPKITKDAALIVHDAPESQHRSILLHYFICSQTILS